MAKLSIKIGIIFFLLVFPLALAVSQDTASKPEAPQNLRITATNADGNSFSIEWDPVPDATEYRIYQNPQGRTIGWTRLLSTNPYPVNTTTAVITKITLNTAYNYRVTALNANGEGAPSEHVGLNLTK